MSVSIKDAQEQVLGNGISDARGNYSIKVRGDSKGVLFARYEKIGYYAYPTIRKVASLKKMQRPVALSRAGAGAEYYQLLVANFAKRSIEDPNDTSIVAALAALPPPDKAMMVEQLKATSSPALLTEFEAADKTFYSSIAISRKLRLSGPMYQSVYVYPNYPYAGSILLYGSVIHPSGIKNAETIAKSVEGVGALKNDVGVKNEVGVRLRF